MSKSLNEHESNTVTNPKKSFIRFTFWIIIIGVNFGYICYSLGRFTEASEVIQEEFNSRDTLDTYNWFKDAAAVIKQKKADIEVYNQQITSMVIEYEGIKKTEWDETDKSQFNQWQIELKYLKVTYNTLIIEYNLQSLKFNWEGFKNDIPKTFEKYKY